MRYEANVILYKFYVNNKLCFALMDGLAPVRTNPGLPT